MSALLLPLAILPALLGLSLSVRCLLKGDFHPAVIALAFQAGVFLFLPSSNILDPLGVSRFVIGLIVALLAFGAYTNSRRVLIYTQFWIISLAFLLGDSFLPHG